MQTLRSVILFLLALPKTIIFNLRYLPLRDALRFPIIVSHRVWLFRMKGSVAIEGPVRPRMIHLGFGQVSIFDQHRSRSIWDVGGSVVFKGRCGMGHGTKLSVHTGAVLTVGSDVNVTAETAIISHCAITIGAGSLLSWDIQIMDTDFHPIHDANGALLNPDTPVVIGEHVWVGCRSLILKGAVIPDGCVVAAGSLISRALSTPNAVIGGQPGATMREGIEWRER
ncbi:MAG: acyltransferase [Bacteroidetes bacterium]|nr:acyltransferase [Bacteroidota bacterium]